MCYGCRIHCPAPPRPVLNAIEYSSDGLTLYATDHFDPSRKYEARIGGDVANRWVEATREHRMAELQALLEGYLAGKGEI